jgi:uncharacterized NAD(P)/FAD-binding protein YdhS
MKGWLENCPLDGAAWTRSTSAGVFAARGLYGRYLTELLLAGGARLGQGREQQLGEVATVEATRREHAGRCRASPGMSPAPSWLAAISAPRAI